MSASDPQTAGRPPVFPPTLREVLLRPRWLGMLVLCLVVAGVFAWLGQWQLGRALQTDPTPPGATEQVRPLADVVAPGAYLPEPLVGQRVTVTGTWVPGDFLVVASRYNDGTEGYWVTGQLRIVPVSAASAPTSIAVAIGWAPTPQVAQSAIDALQKDASATSAAQHPFDVVGRIISDEGTALPRHDVDPQTMTRMSPATLLARWHDATGLSVYRPYLAAQVAPQPLADIASPPPPTGSTVNWLNIFYAVEWAVFAGFAFYLWYRLGRDAWERELEEIEDAAAAAS